MLAYRAVLPGMDETGTRRKMYDRAQQRFPSALKLPIAHFAGGAKQRMVLMRVQDSWRWMLAFFALLVLFLMGCGSVHASPPAQQPTLPPAPTIPDTATTCNEVPALAGAQPTELYHLNFPDDAIASGAITSTPGAPMQVVSYVACLRIDQSYGAPTPMGTAMDQVVATLGFFARGWVFARGFPADGKTLSACNSTEQRCFMACPQTYALLEQTRANGNGLAVFYLSVALPQPLVPCDPILFPIYTYPASIAPYRAAQIPLPPGTRVSLSRSSEQGVTEFFCSAGTANEVSAFMQQHLPQAGWKSVQVAGQQLWTLTTPGAGAPKLYMRLKPITNPRNWSELEYYQGFTP